jgi:hypothetical protein
MNERTANAHRPELPVVWQRHPIIGQPHHRTLDASLRLPTIAEIVADIPEGELPIGFAELGVVRISGDVIPRGLWHLVRPRYRPDYDTIVTLHVALGASGNSVTGGSGKDTARLVATVAVLLVALAVSAGALGPAGLGLSASLAAGSAGAILAAGGIGAGGRIDVDALAPARQ